jgi:dTDP-4-dehydrorhamnose 3,5-epimerase
MKKIDTHLAGCFIIVPEIHRDARGSFFESFRQDHMESFLGAPIHFVQDNQSQSEYGVVRGLHFQTGQYAQSKLVRVLEGTVLDVAVDLRPQSQTYGQHVAVELSTENKHQLFIPKGFAHGYAVLSPTATLFYKVDQYYNPDFEDGIAHDDAALHIDWKLPVSHRKLSEKDVSLRNITPKQ